MKKARKLLKIIIIIIISFMFIANTNIVTCTDKKTTEQTNSQDEEKKQDVSPPKIRGDTDSRSTSDGKSYTEQEAVTIDENIESANNFIEKRTKPIWSSRR